MKGSHENANRMRTECLHLGLFKARSEDNV
jgi:hypothetical protein